LHTTSSNPGEPPLIEIHDVSVRYRVPRERVHTFKEYAIKWLRRKIVFEELCAVSHASLDVRHGQALGVVGRNGAGKSTLLKVIARVLRPTEGSVVVRGRLAPLLELGAGFDLELTGRENVFLNGAILGRSRRDMVRRFDEIVEFAELHDFIDAPLRTYSTGMVARLGFAVATDVEADVLLVDESLSVGDFEFQKKCMARIHAMRRGGAALVLVSHAPDVVRSLCDRVIWLDSGRIVADGAPGEVLDAFATGAVPARATAS
jgi:ABC-type polysaccharide/polyol phosphate transport system ATPase subunit